MQDSIINGLGPNVTIRSNILMRIQKLAQDYSIDIVSSTAGQTNNIGYEYRYCHDSVRPCLKDENATWHVYNSYVIENLHFADQLKFDAKGCLHMMYAKDDRVYYKRAFGNGNDCVINATEIVNFLKSETDGGKLFEITSPAKMTGDIPKFDVDENGVTHIVWNCTKGTTCSVNSETDYTMFHPDGDAPNVFRYDFVPITNTGPAPNASFRTETSMAGDGSLWICGVFNGPVACLIDWDWPLPDPN
jgi:hypothetical protein